MPFLKSVPYTDAFATVVGFIPVYGDAFSAGYFLTQDAVDCLQGDACDPLDIGLDIAGSIPMIGDAARLAKPGARYADLFPTLSRLFRNADGVGDGAAGAGRAINNVVDPDALKGLPTESRTFREMWGPENVYRVDGTDGKTYFIQVHDRSPQLTPGQAVHWHIRDTGGRYIRNPLDTTSPRGGIHWYYGNPLAGWWPRGQ
jgi:hypothetical protein